MMELKTFYTLISLAHDAIFNIARTEEAISRDELLIIGERLDAAKMARELRRINRVIDLTRFEIQKQDNGAI